MGINPLQRMETELGPRVRWAAWTLCNMCTVLSVTQTLASDREWPMAAATLFFLLADRERHPVRYTLVRVVGLPDYLIGATVGITVVLFEIYLLNEAAQRPVPILTHWTPIVGAFAWLNAIYCTVVGMGIIVFLVGLLSVGLWLKFAELTEASGGVGTIEITLDGGKVVVRPQSLLDQIEKIAPVHRNEQPPEGTDPCSICMNPLTEERFWRKTPCGHLFHADCADYWWRSHKTCPMCNQRLDKFGTDLNT